MSQNSQCSPSFVRTNKSGDDGDYFGPSTWRDCELTKLRTSAMGILLIDQVTTPVALVTLVYLRRARPHLAVFLRRWSLEQVFLVSVVLATKYLNDGSIPNADWACYTGMIGKHDLNRIEREFLEMIDWELRVTECDVTELRSVLELDRGSSEVKKKFSSRSRNSIPRHEQGSQRIRRGRKGPRHQKRARRGSSLSATNTNSKK
ncbi:hypothetical protein PM082_000062 [Marasmius tenuissimus]|nr:hypothetical protein PM082_000062 [Marasmius tenuissimus]